MLLRREQELVRRSPSCAGRCPCFDARRARLPACLIFSCWLPAALLVVCLPPCLRHWPHLPPPPRCTHAAQSVRARTGPLTPPMALPSAPSPTRTRRQRRSRRVRITPLLCRSLLVGLCAPRLLKRTTRTHAHASPARRHLRVRQVQEPHGPLRWQPRKVSRALPLLSAELEQE